ncbi:MAG: hypothetical protein K0S76_736 [Herbinix sp.]|jgi:RNA polymerase primary sigma factor|nr:hypothetical protein [Herbinix sp.]
MSVSFAGENGIETVVYRIQIIVLTSEQLQSELRRRNIEGGDIMTNEELVDRIQQGIDPGVCMEQLYRQNYGYIYKIAHRLAYSDDIEDLLQEAYFGLYEAVQRYENTAGVLFMSYASFWIKQSIKRYKEKSGRCIRIPSGMQEQIYKYKKLISAYQTQIGRMPTDKECCRYLGCGIKALESIKKTYEADNIQSLDDYLPGTEDLILEESIPDHGVDVENNIVDGMIEKAKRTELWQIVKDNVCDNENAVITARFRKNMSLEAIGQLMGLTRERVRQIEANGLRKLRRSRVLQLLEEKFEINYARAYNGSVTNFKYTGTSVVESIAIRNEEHDLWFIEKVLKYGNLSMLTASQIELAKLHGFIDENMEI